MITECEVGYDVAPCSCGSYDISIYEGIDNRLFKFVLIECNRCKRALKDYPIDEAKFNWYEANKKEEDIIWGKLN